LLALRAGLHRLFIVALECHRGRRTALSESAACAHSGRQDVGVLVVMSGLPASGKSTVADLPGRKLGAAVLSIDPIEAAIWRAGIAPSFETGVAEYDVAGALAAHQLALGHTVIADVTGVASYPDLETDLARRLADRDRATDCVGGTVEGGGDAVTSELL
jgi:hypothetical protein